MLVLPERERTKKGAIGVETKGVTCKIPLDLHNQISEEIRETESTMSKFIEMVIREHYEKGANRIMEKGRTLAFQVIWHSSTMSFTVSFFTPFFVTRFFAACAIVSFMSTGICFSLLRRLLGSCK